MVDRPSFQPNNPNFYNPAFLEQVRKQNIANTRSRLAQQGLNLAGRFIDNLSRVSYGTTNIVEDYTRTGQFTPLQSFKQGVTLREKPTYSDVLTNLGYQPTTTTGKIVKGAVGFGADYLLSPETYLGIGGLTALGRARKTVQGLEKLVNAGKLVKQGLSYVAKSEDVGKPLLKTIDRTNKFLRNLDPKTAESLIANSGKTLDKIAEVQAGYRGILRTNPLVTGGFGGGRQLVGGQKVYQGLQSFGKYTDEFKTLKAAKELFRPAYKKIKPVARAEEIGNIKSRKFGFDFIQESNKFADIVKKSNLSDSEYKTIARASEWVEIGADGKLKITNPAKLKKVYGIEDVPDKLKPAVTQFRKTLDMIPPRLRKSGVNISDTRSYLKRVISGLESPEGKTGFLRKEILGNLRKQNISAGKILSKIKLGKTGRLIKPEDLGSAYKVTEKGVVDLATKQQLRNEFNNFFSKFQNKNDFVNWYVARKKETLKTKVPDRFLKGEAVTEYNRINKQIVDKLSSAKKFNAVVQQANIKYGQTLARQKQLLTKSPNYVLHTLTEDAKNVVGGTASSLSRKRYDERTVNFLSRKFTDENKIPLGLDDVNDIEKIYGTRGLTAGRPVFKKETFVSKVLKQRNRKLAEEFDSLLTEKAKLDFVRKHKDQIGEIFETDPQIILETAYQNTTKTIKDAEFQNKIARFGKTESELRIIGNGKIPSGWVQADIPRLKKTSELPQEVVDHINFMSRKLDNIYFPEKIAEAINSVYSSLGKEWGQVYGLIHQATNLLKGYLTVVRPSFFTRNYISSMWMGFADGVKTLEPYKQSLKLQWLARNGDLNSVKNIKIAGYTGDELLKLAHTHSVINAHFYDVGASGKAIPDIHKSMKWLNLGTEGGLIKSGRKTNELIENHVRMATFIDGLEKGLTPLEAGRRTLKIHYNYGDVTDFESKVLAQVIPFYRWMRFNTPRMIELLMQDPRKVLGVTKAVQNAQTILSDNQFVDEMLIPKYVLDNYGVQVTRNNNGIVGYTILGSFLPLANLAGMDSPKALWDTLISSLNPLIKTTVELALNKDVFFDSEIEKYEGESKKYLGLILPRRAVKIIQNVSILDDLDKLLQPKEGESLFRRLVAFNVGLKAYNVDIKKQYKYALIDKKKEQAIIRSQIKNANQKKDQAMATDLKTKLRENVKWIKDLSWALKKSKG